MYDSLNNFVNISGLTCIMGSSFERLADPLPISDISCKFHYKKSCDRASLRGVTKDLSVTWRLD